MRLACRLSPSRRRRQNRPRFGNRGWRTERSGTFHSTVHPSPTGEAAILIMAAAVALPTISNDILSLGN